MQWMGLGTEYYEVFVGEEYNDSVRDSVITLLYSVTFRGLMGMDTPWRTPSSNPYRTP